MGVILQAAYRRQANPTVSVPAPTDGDGANWWYDHLAQQMHALAAVGITDIQLPPVHMTIGGDAPTSDGYGVYWEYNLGTEAKPTRFGSAERLQRMCAIAKANGLNILADWVPHQRYGGDRGVYAYKSVTGKPGRFSKTPTCFIEETTPGGVPRGPLAGAVGDDFGFGDELAPDTSVPAGYVLNGLIDAGDWLFQRLDLSGCRDDDTKGQSFHAAKTWANAKSMAGKIVIGEFADGNRNDLKWWVGGTEMRCMAYDFDVKYTAESMCNNGSKWNMGQLQNHGMASFGWPWSGRAVTFLENADSDTNGFGAVVFNKLLGYAWILTSEGWPSIYYRDYSTDRYCYGLKAHLDNLFWIHEHLANGVTWYRHSEYQFVVYERQGAPGLLVGLNNDIWGGWKSWTGPTSFGANVHLHDYSGHCGDVWTDDQGRVTIGIPPNDNGQGFCCYSRAGLGVANQVSKWKTTQVFEGADDLDIAPATAGVPTIVTRLWCEAGTTAEVISETASVGFSVLDMDGLPLQLSETENGFAAHVVKTGWQSLFATSNAAAALPYKVSVTYQAPQTL